MPSSPFKPIEDDASQTDSTNHLQLSGSTVAVSSTVPPTSALLTETQGASVTSTQISVVAPAYVSPSDQSRTSSSAPLHTTGVKGTSIPHGMSDLQAAVIGVSVTAGCAIALIAMLIWRKKNCLRFKRKQNTETFSSDKDNDDTEVPKGRFASPRASYQNSKPWEWSAPESGTSEVFNVPEISSRRGSSDRIASERALPKPQSALILPPSFSINNVDSSVEEVHTRPSFQAHQSQVSNHSHRTARDSWGSEIGRKEAMSVFSSKTTMSSVNPFFYDSVNLP